ncbi:hypothetical protein IP65_09830 [Novosphingobium sp. AAP1]|nr:hypothetical protein IP65_09830 [Novosphingobium sp. AAP1]
MLPVRESDLISDEAIFLLEIVANAPNSRALFVDDIGPGLRAQIGASDRADLALNFFAALDRVKDRYDTAAIGRRLQLSDALLSGQFDEHSLEQTRIPLGDSPQSHHVGHLTDKDLRTNQKRKALFGQIGGMFLPALYAHLAGRTSSEPAKGAQAESQLV